jgi:S1-C subfamily serine protease
MNVVDVIIIVFAFALAALGYERGLISSGLPLIGFVIGAVVGGRLGPALLEGGGESPYAPLITVLAALLLGATFALALEGVGEAVRIRHLSGGGLVTRLDRMGGAALMGALALLVAWVFGAAALNAPGPGERGLRSTLQSSRILGALNNVLPPTGPLLNLLRHVDPVPALHGPQANVGTPNSRIARAPGVRSAGDGVVKVLGTACGLSIEGSGWVGGRDIVVTNAHVVAGESDTTVTTRSGTTLDAKAVHYEPRNDLAILRVPGLGLTPLNLASQVSRGTPGAVLGYPENGPFTVSPARVGSTGRVLSEDSYGRGPVEREMTPFRGDVRSGNSGGPVVDAAGRVLTTVFASAKGPGAAGGLGVPDAIVRHALDGALHPTSTGPCAA